MSPSQLSFSHFRYITRPLQNVSCWAWRNRSLPQICHWHLNEKATHSLSFSFHSLNSNCTCMFFISLFQRKTDKAHKDLKLSCLPQRDISVFLEFPSACFPAGLAVIFCQGISHSECLFLKQPSGAFPQRNGTTCFTPPSQREPAIRCVDYGEECWRGSQRYVRSANLTGSTETSEISYPHAVTRS